MVFPNKWLSILTVNSLMLFNVSFPILMWPNIVNGAEVIVQTNPNTEAKRLFKEGLELNKEGTEASRRQAIVKLEEALLLYRKTEDLMGEYITLVFISSAYDQLGEKQKALNYKQQASATIQKVIARRQEVMGPINAEAVQLFKEGLELNKEGTEASRRQAIAKWEEALLLYKKTGNLSGEALILFLISRVYNDLGEQQIALNYYQQAVALRRQILARRGAAMNPTDAKAAKLFREGLELNKEGTEVSRRQAIAKWEEALLLYKKTGNLSGEALILFLISRVYNDLGEQQIALNYYQQAVALRRQIRARRGKIASTNPNTEAAKLFKEGLELSKEGTEASRRQAIAKLEKALLLFRKGGNPNREAATLFGIGRVYSDLGEKQKALNYLQQALPLSRQVGDRRVQATTLYSIGFVYSDLGEKQKALNYLQQAIPLFQQIGDRRGEATTLINISNVYDSLGEQQKARDYYQQALPLFQQVGGSGAGSNNFQEY